MRTLTLDDGQTIELSDDDYRIIAKTALGLSSLTISYRDIAQRMFLGKPGYWVGDNAEINRRSAFNEAEFIFPLNAKTFQQLDAMVAMNIWNNVATYLNDGWVFKGELSYSVAVDGIHEMKPRARYIQTHDTMYGAPVFETEDLARQSVKILGEGIIIKALSGGLQP